MPSGAPQFEQGRMIAPPTSYGPIFVPTISA
jgi:hypothetical protein